MNILGLDLGTNNFKAIEIKKEKGVIELVKYGIAPLPDTALTSDNPDTLDKYSLTLANFARENGFSTNYVNIGLPESSVFTRIIKVPKMTEKELKSSISYEAEQYIPLPLKDVNFDFQILEDETNSDPAHMDVLLVAATKSLVEKYVKIVKNAGMVPVGLEPETLAITRIVGDSKELPNPSIVVNISADSTNVIVTHKGIVRFSRNIATGGNALTRVLSQELGFDFSQAEEFKKTYGLDSNQVDGKVYAALKPAFDIVLNEIKRTYYFYTTHNPGVNIRRVVVCGGTALMPGMLLYLTANLDLEVELANPWRKMQFPAKFDKEKQILLDRGPSFVTAVGLALKEN